MFYGDPTARSSPVTRLPQETVEVITAHLIYDTGSILPRSPTFGGISSQVATERIPRIWHQIRLTSPITATVIVVRRSGEKEVTSLPDNEDVGQRHRVQERPS